MHDSSTKKFVVHPLFSRRFTQMSTDRLKYKEMAELIKEKISAVLSVNLRLNSYENSYKETEQVRDPQGQ